MLFQIHVENVRVNDKCTKVSTSTSNKEFNKPQNYWSIGQSERPRQRRRRLTLKSSSSEKIRRRSQKKCFCLHIGWNLPPCVLGCFIPFPSKNQPEFWVINKCVQSFQRRKTFSLLLPSPPFTVIVRQQLRCSWAFCLCVFVFGHPFPLWLTLLLTEADIVSRLSKMRVLLLIFHFPCPTSVKQKPIDFIFFSDFLLIFLTFLVFLY